MSETGMTAQSAADDGDRECIRLEREILDAPPECEQDKADVAEQWRGARQHLPMKHVEPGNHRHPNESRREDGKQEQPVGPGLIAVDRTPCTLAKQGGVDAVGRERAETPDEEQHRE